MSQAPCHLIFAYLTPPHKDNEHPLKRCLIHLAHILEFQILEASNRICLRSMMVIQFLDPTDSLYVALPCLMYNVSCISNLTIDER